MCEPGAGQDLSAGHVWSPIAFIAKLSRRWKQAAARGGATADRRLRPWAAARPRRRLNIDKSKKVQASTSELSGEEVGEEVRRVRGRGRNEDESEAKRRIRTTTEKTRRAKSRATTTSQSNATTGGLAIGRRRRRRRSAPRAARRCARAIGASWARGTTTRRRRKRLRSRRRVTPRTPQRSTRTPAMPLATPRRRGDDKYSRPLFQQAQAGRWLRGAKAARACSELVRAVCRSCALVVPNACGLSVKGARSRTRPVGAGAAAFFFEDVPVSRCGQMLSPPVVQD